MMPRKLNWIEVVVFINPYWVIGALLLSVAFIAVSAEFSVSEHAHLSTLIFLEAVAIFQVSLPYLVSRLLLSNTEVCKKYFPTYLYAYFAIGIISLLAGMLIRKVSIVFGWGDNEHFLIPALLLFIPYFMSLFMLIAIASRLLDVLSVEYLRQPYGFVGAIFVFIYFPVFLYLIQRRLNRLRLAGAPI